MRRLLLTLILALAAAAPAQAQLMVRHWAAPQGYSCPAGYYNGCSGNTGQVVTPNLLSFSAQSGQTYAQTGLCTNLNCHPPWQMPGVDVANGALTPVANQRDPAVVYPTNCTAQADQITYCATGNTINGGPRIFVKPVAAGLTASTINISAIGGHSCTQIVIYYNSGAQNITLTDLYFENDATCSPQCSSGTCNIIAGAGSPPGVFNFALSHSTFIGHGQVSDCCSIPHTGTTNIPNAMFEVVSIATTGSQTISYINVKDWPGHVYGLGGSSSSQMSPQVTLYGNYFQSAAHTRCPQGHGELGNVLWTTTYTNLYETKYQTTQGSACDTAVDSIEQSGTTITNIEVGYNVTVNNRLGGAPANTESVTISGMVNGVMTVSSGGAYLAPGAIFQTNATAFAYSLGGGQWQSDCGVNAVTGHGLSQCPNNTSSAGFFNNVAGNDTSYTDTVGYYQGNANLSLGHAVTTSVNIHDNYTAPTGTRFGNFISNGGATCAAPATMTGNINMETGAANNTWDAGAGGGC